jgi:hypothetical protein
MLNSRRPKVPTLSESIPILLFLLALGLSGCHSTHAQPVPAQPSAAAKSQPSAPPASKHPPRDSEFTVYHNPAYGLSFRYPRTYLLDDELDSEDPSILAAQQQLAARQPGSLLVAIVTIPDDAYPNTTFSSASLHLVLTSAVTADTCQSFADPADDSNSPDAATVSGAPVTFGSASTQSIPFHWRQKVFSSSGATSLHRDYTGFSRGVCYEFFLELTTTSASASDPSSNPDSAMKPADSAKILRQLDKIVSSLQLHPVPAPSPGLPVVHSFTVAPLSHPDLAGVYRASWQIAGASSDDVFISVDCAPAVGVYHLSAPASAKAGFPCGIFTPAAPHSGSLDFQLDNHSPRDIPVTVTLFLPTLGYGTRTVLVPSSHRPVSD